MRLRTNLGGCQNLSPAEKCNMIFISEELKTGAALQQLLHGICARVNKDLIYFIYSAVLVLAIMKLKAGK